MQNFDIISPWIARPFVAVALITLMVGCTPSEDQIRFDGLAFRAKASPVDKKKSRADFEVTVKKAAAALDPARDAGRYEGTRYCVRTFGSSKIDWANGGPDAETVTMSGEDLILRGRCKK